MTLSTLGWRPFFAASFERLDNELLIPARIARQERGRYVLAGSDGPMAGVLLGRLQNTVEDATELPAVGDWVAAEVFDSQQAVIHTVLPRSSKFIRKAAGGGTRAQVLAANVDTAFLVTGLDGDFNVRRIERYLVQAAGSGVQSVVVLNKADLRSDVDERVREVTRHAPGWDVVPVSARNGDGMDALRSYASAGQTVVFLGSSGVGKSTIINHLVGEPLQRTGHVREDDSRGRHTTTFRELIALPDGGLVIDTPGLRELRLWSDQDDLDEAFPEIEALAAGCRFRDCTHDREPGCAVLAALDDGALEPDRFESYQKLARELRYLEARQNEAARLEMRRKEKRFGKMQKRINQNHPRRRW